LIVGCRGLLLRLSLVFAFPPFSFYLKVVCVVLPWLDGWGWQGRLAACLTLDRALSVLASLVRAWVPRDPWLRMADGRRERLSEVTHTSLAARAAANVPSFEPIFCLIKVIAPRLSYAAVFGASLVCAYASSANQVVQRQRLVMQRHLHPPPAVVGGPARVAMGDALLADLEPPEEHKPKVETPNTHFFKGARAFTASCGVCLILAHLLLVRQIAWLKRRLETTRGRVESLREELKAATDQEVRAAGVSMV
jgi:cell division protein FtsB